MGPRERLGEYGEEEISHWGPKSVQPNTGIMYSSIMCYISSVSPLSSECTQRPTARIKHIIYRKYGSNLCLIKSR